MIDTGANKNYISSQHVKIQNCKKTKPLKVKNVNGAHTIDTFVEFNPFPHVQKNKATFYVFDFHPFFDGLIGYETLRNMKAEILTASNQLRINNAEIRMFRKFPQTTCIQLNSNETKLISIPLTDNGDFLVETDVEISPGAFILAGLYKSENYFANVLASNKNESPNEIQFSNTFDLEVNNLENIVTDQIPYPENCNKNRNIIEQLRLNHLNFEERKGLIKLISKYDGIFHKEGEPLTFTNAIKHKITTTDDVPVYTKSYRYPYCHKDEVRLQIEKMLDQGIIRPSISPWSSPIWIVPKKLDASGQKKWRLVIDYRKLNQKTISDRYPIPNITEILDKLGRSVYFSTLDLASGFHQIEVDQRDVQKTAFSVDNGHYEFVRMPFGLKNAPSTFQRVMDNILREHIGVRCLVYMDDIIVFSTSLQEHLTNLKLIFDTLKKYNMKVQLDKSEFLHKEVAFLGHIVTQEGVKPNPQKVETIKKWPIPKTEKDLRAFLGILGYYRKFIKDFARIAKPLTQQLRKGEHIEHTNEFIDAFNRCKNILTSSQILIYPEFDKPFILTTDASKYAIGAVLSQGPIGKDRPISFASRTLTKTEEKYSTIEKELLAIHWACKYFRPYLYGRKFTLYTDHKPLTFALNLKDPHHKLVRWKLRLEEFDYEIRHRPGRQNVVADGLSRMPNETDELETAPEEINFNSIEQKDSSNGPNNPQDAIFIEDVNNNDQDGSSDDMTVHSADTDDGQFIPMTELPLNYFKNQIIIQIGENEEEKYEEIFPSVFRRTITKLMFGVPFFIGIFKNYMHPTRVNGILCPEKLLNTLQVTYRNYFSRNRLFKVKLTQKLFQDVTTLEEQNQIIESTHDRAHRGIEENLATISKKFYFPLMRNKIRNFINLCPTCLENKYERNPYKIKYSDTPIPKKPLDILHVDIYISSPNLFITAVDKLSRYAIIIPIKSRSIPDVKKGIIKLITTHGTPNLIVCDNEVALKSPEVRGLLQRMNVEMYFTPPGHSEVNGIVERFHSTLAEIYLCIHEKYNDVSAKELYRIATSLYNNSIHSATKLKPIEVFFGIKEGEERPLNLETILANRNQIFDEVVNRITHFQNKTIKKHNQNREAEPHLEENESVYNKIPGIKTKRKPRFRRLKVRRNHNKTFTDYRNIKVHKAKIKRKRKH